MDEIRVGAAAVHVLPVVRGLPSAGKVARDAIESLRPDVVALSIAPEELDALRRYKGGRAEPDNVEEEVYMAGLAAWEEPMKPAPCFTEALRAAAAHGVPVEGIDMDEEAYTEAYTGCVSAMELILQGRREARLQRTKFRAKTPDAFVLEWDAVVNQAVGFARLQREREAHMVSRLRELSARSSRILAVIEIERVKGVLAALRG